MIELQQSTKEGYDVMMQLQKTLESKLQEQQDALWVKPWWTCIEWTPFPPSFLPTVTFGCNGC